jgi:cobalt-zinc-cadmium efflux system outer membrane protein
MRAFVVFVVTLCELATLPAAAQDARTPLTRAQAIQQALTRGARLGVTRADTAVAFGQLLTARTLPNPTLSASYSKAIPRYHVTADLPLDFTWLRGTRVGSAQAARQAAQYRFQFERAAVALDADTLYTQALAAFERARLSARNAQDADSLRRMAIARRDAGDASDLDVELATVNAGQQANAAAADSLTLVSALLDLQAAIGLADDQVTIAPVDSLTAPPMDSAPVPTGASLSVAAAEAALISAQLAARVQRRSVLGVPSLTFGFESGDPTGAEPGILPTVGIALPLPLLNQNRGPVVQAEAERERARAELELARLESSVQVARTRRERAVALARIERDRRLVASANRVAAMSLRAYHEGASSLPSVLEAQRNAREILAQYVDDLSRAWIATATLRVLTLTPASGAAR